MTVDGDGSTWTNSGDLYVGGYDNFYGPYYDAGSGTLVSPAAACNLRLHRLLLPAEGFVTVDGDSSTWTNSSDLYVCGFHDGSYCGFGMLNITGGSAVTASSVGLRLSALGMTLATVACSASGGSVRSPTKEECIMAGASGGGQNLYTHFRWYMERRPHVRSHRRHVG